MTGPNQESQSDDFPPIPPVRTTDVITTHDGRSLAFVDMGDPNGPLVIHNHGGPSSRLEARLLSNSATKNRLRLVCVDRPGIGQSSAQLDRSFSGWANDIVSIADALGHREFGVTGWSEGGPYALAAAAYIDPGRLRHVSSIAGASHGAFGDDWAAEYLSKIDAFGGMLAMRFRPAFRLMYEALDLTATHFRKTYLNAVLKSVDDYDRQILLRPGFDAAFYDAGVECFAQGPDGLVQDATLLYRSWAFDVTRIERRVHLWQGTVDLLVPSIINKTISDQMPGAAWHSIAGAGHFIAIGAGDEIFALAAAELGA